MRMLAEQARRFCFQICLSVRCQRGNRVQPSFEKIWEVVPEYWGDAPYPTLTAVGVTWLYGYDFEIKVIAKLPEQKR